MPEQDDWSGHDPQHMLYDVFEAVEAYGISSQYEDDEVLVEGGTAETRELIGEAERLATALDQGGVDAHDVVGVLGHEPSTKEDQVEAEHQEEAYRYRDDISSLGPEMEETPSPQATVPEPSLEQQIDRDF